MRCPSVEDPAHTSRGGVQRQEGAHTQAPLPLSWCAPARGAGSEAQAPEDHAEDGAAEHQGFCYASQCARQPLEHALEHFDVALQDGVGLVPRRTNRCLTQDGVGLVPRQLNRAEAHEGETAMCETLCQSLGDVGKTARCCVVREENEQERSRQHVQRGRSFGGVRFLWRRARVRGRSLVKIWHAPPLNHALQNYKWEHSPQPHTHKHSSTPLSLSALNNTCALG